MPTPGTLRGILRAEQRGALSERQLEKLAANRELYPGFDELSRYMTPEELQKSLMESNAQKIGALSRILPSAAEMSAVAKFGEAKRGWYRYSAGAVRDTFGPDAPRFTALLASFSPQNSVEANLTYSLKVWERWVAAGRPTDTNAIKTVIAEALGPKQAEGMKAWTNNATRSLQASDSQIGEVGNRLILSGPKVDSFMRNLWDNVNEVTNDAWQANYEFGSGERARKAGVLAEGKDPQTLYAGSLTATDSGKGPGYIASSARKRQAADLLGWEPREVQETIWSVAKPAYERQRKGVPARALLQTGELSPQVIRDVPDFSSMMHAPQNLELLGRAGLTAPTPVEWPALRSPDLTSKEQSYVERAMQRLEALRKSRGLPLAGAGIGAGVLAAQPDTSEAAVTGRGALKTVFNARQPDLFQSEEMSRKLEAAKRLAEGERTDKVFRETGWFPENAAGSKFVPFSKTLKDLKLNYAGSPDQLEQAIIPYLAREVPGLRGAKLNEDLLTKLADPRITQDIRTYQLPITDPFFAKNNVFPLEDLLDAPILFNERPEFRQMKSFVTDKPGAAIWTPGSLIDKVKTPSQVLFELGTKQSVMDAALPRDVALMERTRHEMTHAFQHTEPGRNAGLGKYAGQKFKRFEHPQVNAYASYLSTPGENQAWSQGYRELYERLTGSPLPESPSTTEERLFKSIAERSMYPPGPIGKSGYSVEPGVPFNDNLFGKIVRSGTVPALASGAVGLGVLAPSDDAEAGPALRALVAEARGGEKLFERKGDRWIPRDDVQERLKTDLPDQPDKPLIGFRELPPGEESARKFRGALTAGKENIDPGEAWKVDAYDVEGYNQPGVRLFLADDGKAGFAIKPDGDIVSLFNDPSGKNYNVARSALALSSQEGGTKLDNFGTLTPLYEDAGARPVTELPFSAENAPPGWKPDYGQPPVNHMILDPNWQGPRELISDYGRGALAQSEALAAGDDYLQRMRDYRSRPTGAQKVGALLAAPAMDRYDRPVTGSFWDAGAGSLAAVPSLPVEGALLGYDLLREGTRDFATGRPTLPESPESVPGDWEWWTRQLGGDPATDKAFAGSFVVPPVVRPAQGARRLVVRARGR